VHVGDDGSCVTRRRAALDRLQLGNGVTNSCVAERANLDQGMNVTAATFVYAAP